VKTVIGGHGVPSPSAVTKKDTVTTPTIPMGAPAVISTAPAIKGGDAPKVIIFTVVILPTSNETVTFHMFRDGAEVDATDAYMQGADPAAPTPIAFTLHWYDPSPGKGAPVYDIRAESSAAAGTTANGRRLTVMNA
jgi:hypothetical protein